MRTERKIAAERQKQLRERMKCSIFVECYVCGNKAHGPACFGGKAPATEFADFGVCLDRIGWTVRGDWGQHANKLLCPECSKSKE